MAAKIAKKSVKYHALLLFIYLVSVRFPFDTNGKFNEVGKNID